MKKIYVLTLSITFALFGCKESDSNSNQEEVKDNQVEVIDDHTSETALDWDGTYKGFLPCASCPGILTKVKLNKDKTFEKSDLYLENKDGQINDKGTFSFDKNGRNITLKYKDGFSEMYAVGENRLTMLDKDGEKITSEFAKMFELAKVSNDFEFSNTPIKGLVTFGHEVHTFEPCGTSKIYWISNRANSELAKAYNKKLGSQSTPYTPLMAELIVKKSDKAPDGFAKQYDGVIEVIEVKSVEHIAPENYCD